MRVLYASDLHVEFKRPDLIPPLPPADTYDVVVLAGDVGPMTRGFRWARDTVPGEKPVIYLPGNHEYYGADVVDVDEDLEAYALGYTGIHVLNPGEVLFDDVLFVGAPLWTNFSLAGYEQLRDSKWELHLADFRVIRIGNRRFTPADARALYERHVTWIKGRLGRAYAPADRKVVVTHFMPSQAAIDPQFLAEGFRPLNPYFCNDLDSIMTGENAPDHWFFGHTHTPFEGVVGKTQLHCNPFGYPNENVGTRAWKIVEV